MRVNSKDKPNAVVIPGGRWSFSFDSIKPLLVSELELNYIDKSIPFDGDNWFETSDEFGLYLVYGTSIDNLTVEKLTHG